MNLSKKWPKIYNFHGKIHKTANLTREHRCATIEAQTPAVSKRNPHRHKGKI